ncbi:MAG: methyltransferase domain-containing protein [Microthrixaceae bacterium]
MTDRLGELALAPGMTIDHVIEWRPRVWGPAVASALSAGMPLEGKRVLELGPRSGRISALLAFNGARVLGAELPGTDMTGAQAEVARWGVDDRVEFTHYSGDPSDLPDGPFDLVVSKSVLVVVPELPKFFEAISDRLGDGGSLVCAENRRGGAVMKSLRRLKGHHWAESDRFSGVGSEFMAALDSSFTEVDVLYRNPMVCAIRAHN